jgi:hypothetical protein
MPPKTDEQRRQEMQDTLGDDLDFCEQQESDRRMDEGMEPTPKQLAAYNQVDELDQHPIDDDEEFQSHLEEEALKQTRELHPLP